MKKLISICLLALIGYILVAVCPVVNNYAIQIVMAGLSGFLLVLAIVLAYTAGAQIALNQNAKAAKGD